MAQTALTNVKGRRRRHFSRRRIRRSRSQRLSVEFDKINGAGACGRPVRANAGQTKDIDDGDDNARRLERGGRMNRV